jgi:hypothetical protein
MKFTNVVKQRFGNVCPKIVLKYLAIALILLASVQIGRTRNAFEKYPGVFSVRFAAGDRNWNIHVVV